MSPVVDTDPTPNKVMAGWRRSLKRAARGVSWEALRGYTAPVSEHADQFEDEPGDEPERDADEIEEPEEDEPWAKTSSGDADEI
jgi:hypothetical protein